MEFKPHDYQKRAIDFLKANKAAGLFLDMGLGKTAITLTAINDLMYDSFEIARVLVIAPLRVAEDTWTRETQKWDHLKHMRVAKILGTAAERRKAIEEDADVYVVNRENVVWLAEYFEDQKRPWPFDTVIIDELSSFKSNQAQRFKALRKARASFDRVIGLTGTPAANSLMDLWAEMYLLDRGERLGRTITGYRAQYFKPAWGNGAVVYKWDALPGAREAIAEKISDITMSMSARDYLQLPERIDSTVRVFLSAGERKKYKAMERDSLLPFDDREDIAAFDAGAVMNKLLQLANGFIYTEDHEAVRIHEAKLDALGEIIEAADGPVLVFFSFQADRQALLSRYPQAEVLEDAETIRRWNAGEISVLIAHPASVAYGLNLQDGGHIIAWYGLPWSLELYTQANARLHRQGQDKPVLIYHILAADTVDEEVARKLEAKDTTQSALLAILRDRKAGTGEGGQKA